MKFERIRKLHARLAALVTILLASFSFSSAQETALPLPEVQIREATIHILEKADKVNCKPRGCKILVANFTLPSGLTSQLGTQLADQFAKELASQQTAIQVIDRSILQTYLEKERISPDLLANDKAMRWLGKQLNSTTVLMGTTKTEGSLVRVQVNLFSCNKEKTGPTEIFTLPLPESKNALSGFDPITKLVSKDRWPPASGAYTAGVFSVSQPACLYCPDPPYPEAGRSAKFQGQVVLEVVVAADGHAKGARVIRGAPFGMNEQALTTVREWRFKPATRNGEAVTAIVTIDIGFRLLN
jgi:TonB family protein